MFLRPLAPSALALLVLTALPSIAQDSGGQAPCTPDSTTQSCPAPGGATPADINLDP